MIAKWFVTGTDTEVGKTLASCALLQAARRAGHCAVGYKPVASGSEMTAEGIRNADALALQSASALPLSYQEINPLAFLEPTSPHIISAVERRPIDFSIMSQGLRNLERQANWVLIEGAGGWYTPLSQSTTFADWVKAEQLPVIVVVGVKLGCINHARLTVEAILARGLTLAGWIANQIQPPSQRHAEYLASLKQMIPARLLGEIPRLAEVNHQTPLGDYLDISQLSAGG